MGDRTGIEKENEKRKITKSYNELEVAVSLDQPGIERTRNIQGEEEKEQKWKKKSSNKKKMVQNKLKLMIREKHLRKKDSTQIVGNKSYF